jgi:PhnB protein
MWAAASGAVTLTTNGAAPDRQRTFRPGPRATRDPILGDNRRRSPALPRPRKRMSIRACPVRRVDMRSTSPPAVWLYADDHGATPMTQLNAYLSFDGNCAEAMTYYARLLGARIETMMTFGEVPGCEPPPPGYADKIMHAYLVHDGFSLMAGDMPPGMPYGGVQGVMLALVLDTAAEARRVFAALAEGGQVQMPLGETFWAELFGMVTDRYGVPWGISGGPKALPRG